MTQRRARLRRRNGVLTLAYLGAGDCEALSDTYGHARGDVVLKAMGRTLAAELRAVDTAASLGGDECALIFPDTDAAGARAPISKLADEIRSTVGVSHRGVTWRVGVVTFIGSGASLQSALAAADAAMHQVERGGKNALEFCVSDEAVSSL